MPDRTDHCRLKLAKGLAFVLLAAVALGACGRRGDPLAPSAAAVLATDDQGQVVRQPAKPVVPDRPFILDGLIQ